MNQEKKQTIVQLSLIAMGLLFVLSYIISSILAFYFVYENDKRMDMFKVELTREIQKTQYNKQGVDLFYSIVKTPENKETRQEGGEK